jgi:hypothetical protein
MDVKKILPDPKWKLEEIVNHDFITGNSFFVGCVSFEDRCKTAVKKMLPVVNQSFPMTFIEFENDECTYSTWKDKCDYQINGNWTALEGMMHDANIKTNERPIKYRMVSRSEDIFKLKDHLWDFKKKNFPEENGVRAILDFSCIPSYFAFQLLKHLIEDDNIHDLIILYTKPLSYPPHNGLLKTSPFDKTRPDFLPAFGIGGDNARWVVGLGFDYDSVKNAKRIKESLIIEKQYVLIPFPGYEPEYVYRTFYENKKILEGDQSFLYVPADNPFQTFDVLCQIIKDEKNFILSSFGPKPIGLGMTMVAIKLKLPILHVQAINYNPDYSSGEGDTLAYWVKYRGRCWWEY